MRARGPHEPTQQRLGGWFCTHHHLIHLISPASSARSARSSRRYGPAHATVRLQSSLVKLPPVFRRDQKVDSRLVRGVPVAHEGELLQACAMRSQERAPTGLGDLSVCENAWNNVGLAPAVLQLTSLASGQETTRSTATNESPHQPPLRQQPAATEAELPRRTSQHPDET